MLQQYGQVDNVWLAAESGYLYRMGCKNEWQPLISLSNKVWLNSVLEIMLTYAENIDGSIVEERESTLVFNYKNVEEEQGNMMAKELHN